MSKLHDRIKRKTTDIDMNDLLGIYDSRRKLISEKLKSINFENTAQLIRLASELDLEPKEMFLIGFMIREFIITSGLGKDNLWLKEI